MFQVAKLAVLNVFLTYFRSSKNLQSASISCIGNHCGCYYCNTWILYIAVTKLQLDIKNNKRKIFTKKGQSQKHKTNT